MSEENLEAGQTEETIAEGRPAWLPDNFRTPEDLAHSYREAQGKLTQQAQELSSLRGQVDEILASQNQQQYEVQQNDIQGRLFNAMASGDPEEQLAAMAWIAQQAAEQAAQKYKPAEPQENPNEVYVLARTAADELSRRYDDWGEVVGDVTKIAEQYPGLVGEITTRTPIEQIVNQFDLAYRVAKADRVLSASQQAQEVNVQNDRLMKQQAQTITGVSQTPAVTDPATEYWESVKNAPTGGYTPLGRL